MNPSHALERADGNRGGGLNVGHVELHHLVALALALIPHVNAQPDVLVRRVTLTVYLQVVVLEAGVAQPVAERVERLAAEVAVGLPLHAVVVEGRYLIRGLVEGDGEPARRIVVAEEDVGDGRPALLAGVPRLDDRRRVLLRPVDRERAAVHEHQDDGLARGDDRFKQFFLRVGQVQVGAVAAAEAFDTHVHLLAFERRREAERHDDHVRFARRLERLLAQRRGQTRRPPDQLGRGRGVALVILDAEFVSAPRFKLDRLRQSLRAAVAPVLDERPVVEVDAHAVVCARAELIDAR